jgi:hypothetical protein
MTMSLVHRVLSLEQSRLTDSATITHLKEQNTIISNSLITMSSQNAEQFSQLLTSFSAHVVGSSSQISNLTRLIETLTGNNGPQVDSIESPVTNNSIEVCSKPSSSSGSKSKQSPSSNKPPAVNGESSSSSSSSKSQGKPVSADIKTSSESSKSPSAASASSSGRNRFADKDVSSSSSKVSTTVAPQPQRARDVPPSATDKTALDSAPLNAEKEKGPTFKVIVRFDDKYKFEVSKTTTVLELKALIHSSQGVPVTAQVLTFKGVVMEDNKTMQNYNIVGGSQLDMEAVYSFSASDAAAGSTSSSDVCNHNGAALASTAAGDESWDPADAAELNLKCNVFGVEAEFKVTRVTSILRMKIGLLNQFGLEIELQTMTCEGVVLENDKTLAFYDITADSVIEHDYAFPPDKEIVYRKKNGKFANGTILGLPNEDGSYEVRTVDTFSLFVG